MGWENIADAIGTEVADILRDGCTEDIYPIEQRIVIRTRDGHYLAVQGDATPGRYLWETSETDDPQTITDTITLMESVTAWCEAHKPS